jgi:hypothetical protein
LEPCGTSLSVVPTKRVEVELELLEAVSVAGPISLSWEVIARWCVLLGGVGRHQPEQGRNSPGCAMRAAFVALDALMAAESILVPPFLQDLLRHVQTSKAVVFGTGL